jgi:RNA polymerase sigma-70 factor, ECF subfamily
MMTDEALLSEFMKGSDACFIQLMQRYEKKLYSFLFRYLGDAHRAEDLFQETFLQVLRKCRSFDPKRSFRPWLFTIAANLARDELRKKKRHRTVLFEGSQRHDEEGQNLAELIEGGWSDPLKMMEKDEQEERLRKALDQLSEEHQAALILFHFQDLKYKEIADILGIPLGTVKSRIFNATKQLIGWFSPQSVSELEHETP